MRRWLQQHNGVVATVCALVLPVIVSAALAPIHGFSSSAAALVLVLVVVAVASFGSRFAGVVAALSAGAWFDFFLTKPYETFNITLRPALETELSLLVVGIAVTEIAARSRSHREEASEEGHHLALIHDFTKMVAEGEPAEFVVARAAAELTSLLGLRDCRFETEMSEGHPTRIEHSGVVALGGLRWATYLSGLPGHEVELVISFRGGTFGRFVMTPTPGAPVASDRLLVAAFIADQVGAALAAQSTST
jgi:hypothetical protein